MIKPVGRSEPTVETLWAFAIAILLSLGGLLLRPLMPVDETRYLTVAWEMWQRGDFLVPHLNGVPYDHKPPLLFWAIHGIWALFGVSETAGRLTPPLFTLATIALVGPLAAMLWPGRADVAARARLILATFGLFALFGSLVMFDAALSATVVLALVGLVRAWRRPGWLGWLLLALGLGLGGLAKGPVVLVHVMPVAVLAPLWQGAADGGHWRRWYGGLAVALLGGALIALAWAVPAALAGGERYAAEILWSQTADRMVNAIAHPRPWWFYFWILPLAVLPWIVWDRVWRGLGHLRRDGADPGLRLVAVWALSALIGLVVISGKQAHYLLPVLPALALIAARASLAETEAPAGRIWLGRGPVLLVGLIGLAGAVIGLVPGATLAGRVDPGVGLALAALAGAGLVVWRRPTVLLVAAVTPLLLLGGLVAARDLMPAYDLKPLAGRLAGQDGDIAMLGRYRGEFGFLARLTRPVETLLFNADVEAWLKQHPNGLVVARFDPGAAPIPRPPAYAQAYRGRRIGIWTADPHLAEAGS